LGELRPELCKTPYPAMDITAKISAKTNANVIALRKSFRRDAVKYPG
jgi:hypothetical protein